MKIPTVLYSLVCFNQTAGLRWWQKIIKLFFFTGTGIEKNKFDIYDISSNTWSIGELSQNIVGASLISVNNIIYVAGGYINGVLSNKVWKLEF
jgi:N-acetylneuraminic acid mutarotase